MDPIILKIAEGFNVKPHSVIRSKYYYILKTEGHSYVLRQVNCKPNIIEEINDIKSLLYGNGFNSMDTYIVSVQNKPYLYYDGCYYVLTKHFSFQELEIMSTAEVCSAIATLGECQSIARGHTKKVYSDILGRFKAEEAKLFQIKKSISKKSHLSDIDVLFLKNYDYYFNLCERALSILSENGYSPQEVVFSFCHNAFKEDNILVSPKSAYIINWEALSDEHFTKDLVSFINRYVKKVVFPYSGTMPSLSAEDMIEIYCENNPLEDYEMNILRAELIFPEKYIGLCAQYYNKNRSWAPISVSAQLESIIEQKEFYMEYIKATL